MLLSEEDEKCTVRFRQSVSKSPKNVKGGGEGGFQSYFCLKTLQRHVDEGVSTALIEKWHFLLAVILLSTFLSKKNDFAEMLIVLLSYCNYLLYSFVFFFSI